MFADFLHYLGQMIPQPVQTMSLFVTTLLVVIVLPCWVVGKTITSRVRKWKAQHPEGLEQYLDRLYIMITDSSIGLGLCVVVCGAVVPLVSVAVLTRVGWAIDYEHALQDGHQAQARSIEKKLKEWPTYRLAVTEVVTPENTFDRLVQSVKLALQDRPAEINSLEGERWMITCKIVNFMAVNMFLSALLLFPSIWRICPRNGGRGHG